MGTCNVFGYLNCVQLDVFEGFHPASHDDRQCFKINSNGVEVGIALGVNQSLEESDLAVQCSPVPRKCRSWRQHAALHQPLQRQHKARSDLQDKRITTIPNSHVYI